MKRLLLSIICLLLLSGCGHNSALENALQLRSDLLAASECTFDVSVSADFDNVTYTFDMSCKADRDGNIAFTTTKPESISGITGTISSDGGNLTFDESILAFEVLANDMISPVSSPWFFLTALRSGYLKACERTEEGIHVVANDTYEDKTFQVEIYTNKDMIPIHGEILWNGCRIVSLSITNFNIM